MTCASATFVPLSPLQPRALRCPRATGLVRVIRARAAEAPAAALTAHTDVLQRAARAYVAGGARPPASSVAAALLAAERECKRLRLKSDDDLLRGQWRLVFTSDRSAKFPPFRAIYFPVDARQTFSAEGRFDNCVNFPGGNLAFTGPFRWVSRRNILEFTFSEFRVALGPFKWKMNDIDKEGSTLEGRTVKTLPFFTFFWVTEDFAASRGRSGGLALYAKVRDSGH